MKPEKVYLEASIRPYDNRDYVHFFNKALHAHRSGHLDEAMAAYMATLSINDQDPLVYANFSGLMTILRRFGEGVNLALRAISLNPMLSISYNNAGTAWNGMEKHDKAIEYYRKAIATDRMNTSAMQGLSNSLTMLNRFDEAIRALEPAYKLDPDSAHTAVNFGMAYWGKGDLTTAEMWFKRAAAIDPNLQQATMNLGIIHLLIGNYADGWKEYEHRLHPKLR